MLPHLSEDEWEAVLKEVPHPVLQRVARLRATTASTTDEPQLTLDPAPGPSSSVATPLTTIATLTTTTSDSLTQLTSVTTLTTGLEMDLWQ